MFQLKDDFRSSLFNLALMLVNDLRQPLDAIVYLQKLLKVRMKLLSGSMILLTITLKLRMVLQNIGRSVVGNVLINISPSNIFLTLLFPAKSY